QRERVERGENDGDSNRERELLIKSSGDTRKKCGRNKYGRKYECNADYHSRDFAHRLKCRVTRRHSFFDVTLNCFDNNNRVVNHKPNGEHKSEKRKRVDRKSEQGEQHKRSNQRHWHHTERNQRRAPGLEEDEYDEHDERERFEQRLQNFANTFSDGE